MRQENSTLTNLMLTPEQHCEYNEIIATIPSLTLNQRQLCDIELILNGGFSPLTGFMNKNDYQSVVDNMRLANGALFPIPITLDIKQAFAENIANESMLALRDNEGIIIAILNIEDIWVPNKSNEAIKVFGSDDSTHPAVNYLQNDAGDVYVGGSLIGFNIPKHYDFSHLRNTPQQLRSRFQQLGWSKIIAFQTRNPMHRAHQELTLRAAKEYEASLLIHPVVGMTKPGDIDHFTRVRCYEKLLKYYPEKTTMLSLFPLAMRMAGPREALWHALIRKNYGCTHFIVGRDHAGPGKNAKGEDFYDPYEAQELVQRYQDEIGIHMIPFKEMVYVTNKAQYKPVNEITSSDEISKISGTEFRRRLAEGLDVPEWFSYPEILSEIRKTHPPKQQQGFTVFFTGLSAAGKSTLANALMVKLMEYDTRAVTLLDGDIVRKNLSSELGFSKEHRNLNILRIAYVACEITKHRGIAICAPIAPYESVRQKVREMVSAAGGFIEVYVATPLEVCEKRDPKGLYLKARKGLIPDFTGIDDPYEAPTTPDLSIDTTNITVDKAVQQILRELEVKGYLVKKPSVKLEIYQGKINYFLTELAGEN